MKNDPARFADEHRRVVYKALWRLVLCQAAPVALAVGGFALWRWADGYGWLGFVVMVAGLFFTWKILRCMVVRFPRRGALSLDRATHALLFRDINEIRRRIEAPKFSRIEFTMELNAGVTQRPRCLGLFGVRTTLYVGMPLVFCLSRDEFKAVLAHEIAHVSRRHNLKRRLPLMVQCSLINIYESFGGERAGLLNGLLLRWLESFMPSLVDYARVAGRLHEREADRLAAEVYGVEACARALVKIEALAAIYEEDFHESLEDRMRSSNFPNVCYLDELQRHVEAAIKNQQRVRGLVAIQLSRTNDLTSTHPSLRERLENIGGVWQGEVSMAGGAAEEYFGRGYKQLAKELDQCWLKVVHPAWRRRHDAYKAIQARLQQKLNMQKAGEKLYGYEMLQAAAWTEQLCGRRQGLAAYEQYHQLHPQVDEGCYHYGRLLLANGDERGLERMNALVSVNPGYREGGLLAMKEFYERKQNPEGALWCETQLEAFYRDVEKILEDRFEHRTGNVFRAPDFTKELQESIYRLCSEFASIQRLHVLRKEVHFYPESPFFVVAVTFNFRTQENMDRSKIMMILRDVMELPGDFVVINGRSSPVVWSQLKSGKFDAAKMYDRDDG